MIDIIMAVCNGEKYIKEQIDSILNQTHQDWRLLIHDDGSIDNTVSIIDEYMEKYPQKICLLADGVVTGGAKYNFFHLMKEADADYIMFSDQDDVWEKDKVLKSYEFINKREKELGKDVPILCHSDLKVVDSKLNIINESFFDMQQLSKTKNHFNDLLVQNNITGCTVIMNKALKQLCKEMPDRAIMHDWWLGLLASSFGKIYHMEHKEILYRQHDNNTEGAKNLKSVKYLVKKLFNKREIYDSLNKSYAQAAAFNQIYGSQLSNENKDILRGYLLMKRASKFEKWSLMREYGFMKSGMVRKISYIFFV